MRHRASEEQIDRLDDQVSYMKVAISMGDDELRRKDYIITALTERIPELESPRDTQKEPASLSEKAPPLGWLIALSTSTALCILCPR